MYFFSSRVGNVYYCCGVFAYSSCIATEGCASWPPEATATSRATAPLWRRQLFWKWFFSCVCNINSQFLSGFEIKQTAVKVWRCSCIWKKKKKDFAHICIFKSRKFRSKLFNWISHHVKVVYRRKIWKMNRRFFSGLTFVCGKNCKKIGIIAFAVLIPKQQMQM